MNGDKHPPEMEPQTTEEAEEEEMEEEEERTVLLRKTFRQHAQSSISSTDSEELFSLNSDRFKFVIPDEQHQEQEQEPEKIQVTSGTGNSNESSQLETDVNAIVEIEDVSTRKSGAENGTVVELQRDEIPLAVSKPPSNGEIEEQGSYYTSLNNGISGYKRVELRTENGNEVADLYLERVYEKPSSHNFYCPNCQACITKVIIRDREWVNSNNNNVSEPIPTPVDGFRCTSCLSFLTPIGAWLFPKLASPDPEEKVSLGPGDNVGNRGIRERETFQVSQETRDYQEIPVDRSPDQSVGSAVTDKNEADPVVTMASPSHKATSDDGLNVQEDTFHGKKGNSVESIGIKETGTLLVLKKTSGHLDSEVDRAPVPNQSVDYAVTDKVEGNVMNSIKVGRPDPTQVAAEKIYDQGIQDASINKMQVIDQLLAFDKGSNDKVLETKVDSNALDGAKDNKKGSTVENIVVGIPYTPHESNVSVLDVDNHISTVKKPQIQNQSNGFAVLLEPEIDTKANLTPGLTSLEARMGETGTDTLDDKKGVDVENVVVGIPYTSPEPKRGLLDRFSLPAWLNKAPIPNQSARVVKTEIPKTPELVEAPVVDSPMVSPSLGTQTVERVPDDAAGNREVEAGPVAIPIDDLLDGPAEPQASRYNKWEVVKSIVYGGLAESITSLGIVASAASANTATGNIVVLALANLISGLFILGHNLKGLKSEQFRRTSNETDELEHVDRYEVVLGNRENYLLHCTLVIFSFVLFGLVPPLVYGFSFTNSNDKDFKLAAVAGASLLCIILLAIGKAYIKRPDRWDVYVKTVATYVVIAAGAGGLSYLAGDLLDKLIKKYGWFEESPVNLHLPLPLPEMGLAKPTWESF